MSSPLTADEEAEYTRIIDSILATADLTTVTRKKIRQGLETAIDKDLSDQKDAIKELIEVRFDAMANNPTEAIPTPPSGTASEVPAKRKANGRASSVDGDAADGEIKVSLPPAAKKQKRESSSEDADARLAAELQAQENRLSRGRVTRNANAGKPAKAKPKKKAKKKSEKKVKSDDDDSNAEGGSEADGKKKKAGGGFQKPFNLSYPLQEVTGETQLSRPQVVKKLWAYIKENELQDPSDKRQIRCDDKLQAVFKQSKVDMFQMNKLLGNQLYPIEDE